MNGRNPVAISIGVGIALVTATLWFYWEYYEEPLWDADESGLPGPTDGRQDAYRHCLASCKLTQDFGADTAEVFGDLNEDENDRSAACKQDHSNNRLGRELGAGDESCEDACRNAKLQNAP